MKRRRLRFVRLIKGRYWYFRSKETGNVRLPGGLEDPAFHKAYAELLQERERLRALNKDRKLSSELEARFLAAHADGKKPASEGL